MLPFYMLQFLIKHKLRILGIICLLYWIFDFINLVVISNRPGWLLWYSSAGLFFTSIALLTNNIKLIYTAFCALFFIEAVWSVDFTLKLLFNYPYALTAYAFESSFSRKDFFMTLYHFLIPLSLFMAVISNKKTYKYGWLGALMYASTLLFGVYLFVNPTEDVNCVHPSARCTSTLGFIYSIDNPYRIILVLVLVTIFLYIPSNYFLLKLKKNKDTKKLFSKKKNFAKI